MNRRILQFLFFVAMVVPLFPRALLAQQAGSSDTCKHTITGELQTFELTSKVFENSPTVRVFLPPGYNDPDNKARQYPVLYMLDG